MKLIPLQILALTFLLFSCQKERLKNEKEVLIGKWELQYSRDVRTSQYGSGCWATKKFPDNSTPTTLTFKKSGKVIFEHKGEKNTYRINFNDKKSDDYIVFVDELHDVYVCTDTGAMYDNGTEYLGKFHGFKANFHYGLNKNKKLSIKGYVNDNLLRINSSASIISERNKDWRFSYYNYFRRVN